MSFAFVIVFCLIYTAEAQEARFCNICECQLEYGYYDIHCNTDVLQYIFDPSYFGNSNSGKSYPYRSLAVQNNSIYRLDRQFPKASITSLSLESCLIDYISDSVFSNLHFLEKLVLSHNTIERFHPKAFMGQYVKNKHPMLPLKKLYLDHNRLTTLYQGIFQYTLDIEVLSLAHNPLSLDTPTVKAINGLQFLKKLDISYAELSLLPRNFLQFHRKLRFLDLSGNQFLHVPSVLSDIFGLKGLRLNNNPLVDLERGFPRVKLLSTLYMCNMPQLRQIGPESFSNLTNLEVLHICNNTQLSNIHKDAFSVSRKITTSWIPIKRLYLNNNKCTTLDMELLLDWNKLEELDLTNNPWNCGCENHWMIDDLLINVLLSIDENKAQSLTCDNPSSLQTLRFVDIYKEGKMQWMCWTIHKRLLIYVYELHNKIFPYYTNVLSILVLVPVTLFFHYFFWKNMKTGSENLNS